MHSASNATNSFTRHSRRGIRCPVRWHLMTSVAISIAFASSARAQETTPAREASSGTEASSPASTPAGTNTDAPKKLEPTTAAVPQNAATTAKVPPPTATPPSAPAGELISLRTMYEKGILSEGEYQRALLELGGGRGVISVEKAGWVASLYGLVKSDYSYDTTESFLDNFGGMQVARPSTYAGKHGRSTFSIRDSRFGVRLRGGLDKSVKTSGLFELDFLGNSPPLGFSERYEIPEAPFFTNPTVRVRQAFIALETPVVNFLFGQTWSVLGGQPFYQPATLAIQGIPGDIYSRNPQLRISRTIDAGKLHIDLQAAALRPPSRASSYPAFQNALRVSYDGWKGIQTTGSHVTVTNPVSIHVSSDARRIVVPELSAAPTDTRYINTVSIVAAAFIPVIPAPKTGKANALSLVGSIAYTSGAAEQFTILQSGIGFPALANPTGANPAPRYPQDIDGGSVAYGLDGSLHAIRWNSYRVGAQYYLPFLDGRFFVAGNFSRMTSPNVSDFTRKPGVAADNAVTHLSSAENVYNQKTYADGTLFFDATDALRLGAAYMTIRDRYVDGIHATNHRVHFSALLGF